MKDTDCVRFLQWALPMLRMRWPGFRKVRRQVCRRIDRRIRDLGLGDVSGYGSYLDAHPEEWTELDFLCRITISRFYRDKGVFRCLEDDVIPEIAEKAVSKNERELRCWSIGCASGEEAYTLALLWELSMKPSFPSLKIHILATDTDQKLIERAMSGRYTSSSVKELPEKWLSKGFDKSGERQFCIRTELRDNVEFVIQDIRASMPCESFHLILCRNLVFTYFDHALQMEILERIKKRLITGGALVIGIHESLPDNSAGLVPCTKKIGIYKKEC